MPKVTYCVFLIVLGFFVFGERVFLLTEQNNNTFQEETVFKFGAKESADVVAEKVEGITIDKDAFLDDDDDDLDLDDLN